MNGRFGLCAVKGGAFQWVQGPPGNRSGSTSARPNPGSTIVTPGILDDAHGGWRPHAGRNDPIDILRAADATRQPYLVPLRYGWMLQSPFTFYRGSATGDAILVS